MHRYVFHIDVNSAYLSWSAIKLLSEDPTAVDLRTIPSVVCGDIQSRQGIVVARSIEAKKYGVNSPESLVSALRKCPNLVTVPPDFEWYVKCSKRLMELLDSYTDCLIQFSIDEAWAVFEGYEHVYGDPVEFAYRLKDEIKDKLGFTVNIGVSTNFLLSKMAGDFSKPDKVHSCFPQELKKKMWPLPVSDLLFCGKVATQRLNRLGINTIGDLAMAPNDLLYSTMKNQGIMLKGLANGEDIELGDITASRKNLSHSRTISHDVENIEEAKQILLSLTETLSARLRDDNAYTRCIGVNITTNEFIKMSRQRTLERSTNITKEIYDVVCKLIEEMWDIKKPVRLLGISFHGADEEVYEQLSLFDDRNRDKQKQVDLAMDTIRKRYGSDAIQRASLMDRK